MDENKYAILVGINEYEDSKLYPLKYAEKDCAKIREVLTDPKIGTFKPENVQTLCGKDVTIKKIQEVVNFIMGLPPDAVVLFYFAGHSFYGGIGNDVYISTYDTSVDYLEANSDAGIKMNYLYERLFHQTRVQQLLLIMDCCFSGALVPESVVAGFPSFRGGRKNRYAILSSLGASPSYETDEHKGGSFTYYLVKGLRGEADASGQGTVSLEDLLRYLRKELGDKSFVQTGSLFESIILTKPGLTLKPASQGVISQGNGQFEFQPLRNPLFVYEDFFERLLEKLDPKAFDLNVGIGNNLLEVIRQIANAEGVFVVDVINGRWNIEAASELNNGGQPQGEYIEKTINSVLSSLDVLKLFNLKHHGVYSQESGAESPQKRTVVIPLLNSRTMRIMIVSGLGADELFIGDVFGSTLATLYQLGQEILPLRFDILKARLLDHIKGTYGFVPTAIYDTRFELFTSRLKEMEVYFQPIIYLDEDDLHIESWEALARDPAASRRKAPNDLFEAAQLWGVRFSTELDIHFLEKSTDAYDAQVKRTSGLQRAGDKKPLSVNVFPSSLMRTSYMEAVKASKVKEKYLVLEISERTPLPDPEPAYCFTKCKYQKRWLDCDKCRNELFINRLKEYSHLHINIAIDDFGIGHSSISRLIHLPLNHVKIDNEIIHEEGSRITIRYVNEMIREKILTTSRIVIEGYDEKSKLTLRELYDLGIRYVQGFKVGEASPTIYARLEKEKLASILSDLKQPNGGLE